LLSELEAEGDSPTEEVPFDRLGQRLLRFADEQQRELVESCAPLRENIQRRMEVATRGLNHWMAEAPHPKRGSPELLADLFQAIDQAPQMRWFKLCSDMKRKAGFLFAVAVTIRAVQEPALLRPHVDTHPPVLALAQRLVRSFFVVANYGDVLGPWLDARLERYNETWQRVAERAVELLKGELQPRLAGALRGGAASHGMVVGEAPYLELSAWPMSSCPLAREFVSFAMQHREELGALGEPGLADCPMHSLRPAVLLRLLRLLPDAFAVDENASPGPPSCRSVIRVRLRPSYGEGAGPLTTGEDLDSCSQPRDVAAVACTGAPAIVAKSKLSQATAPTVAVPGAETAVAATLATANGPGHSGPGLAAVDRGRNGQQLAQQTKEALPSSPPAPLTQPAASPPLFGSAPFQAQAMGHAVGGLRPQGTGPASAVAMGGGPGGVGLQGTPSTGGATPEVPASALWPSPPAASARPPTSSPQVLGFEAPASRPGRGSMSRRVGAAAGAEALGSSNAEPQAGGVAPSGEGSAVSTSLDSSPKAERRSIDWSDLQFLERCVRRGLPVDEDWKTTWTKYCEQKKIPADFSAAPPKDTLREFVEQNLWQLVKKDWAKDLMYKVDGQPSEPTTMDRDQPPDSSPREEAPVEKEADVDALQTPAAPDSGEMQIVPMGKEGSDHDLKGAGSKSQEKGSGGEGGCAQDASQKKKKKKEKKKYQKTKSMSGPSEGDDSLASEPGGEPIVLPPVNHKTRMCYAFLEGKCGKYNHCGDAHSQAELRKPNEARQEAQDRLERRRRKAEKLQEKLQKMNRQRGEPQSVENGDPYFKTQLCPNVMKRGRCEHGNACYYAHSQEELRLTPEVMMMNQMMGMPHMMMNHPHMNPMAAMMGPPMVPPQMPMLPAGPPGSIGTTPGGGGEKKNKKDEKTKKRKDRDREKERDKDEEKDRGKERDNDKKEKKDKKDKAAKEKEKGKRLKGGKSAKDAKEANSDRPKKKEARIDAFDL